MLGWRFFLLCVFFVFFLMDVFGGSGSPRRRSREGTDMPEQERWRVLGAFAFPGSHADGPNRIPPDRPPPHPGCGHHGLARSGAPLPGAGGGQGRDGPAGRCGVMVGQGPQQPGGLSSMALGTRRVREELMEGSRQSSN